MVSGCGQRGHLGVKSVKKSSQERQTGTSRTDGTTSPVFLLVIAEGFKLARVSPGPELTLEDYLADW